MPEQPEGGIAKKIETIELKLPEAPEGKPGWKQSNLLPGGSLKDCVLEILQKPKYATFLTGAERDAIEKWSEGDGVMDPNLAESVESKYELCVRLDTVAAEGMTTRVALKANEACILVPQVRPQFDEFQKCF